MEKHDIIIYAIVLLIICIQLFFFLKNFKKIMAYKTIIVPNKNLSIIELNIEEEKATRLDPEYFIENKESYENLEDPVLDDFPEVSASEITASHGENEEEINTAFEKNDKPKDEDEMNLFS